jgi:drug/metabolite transporter (DMT)-like permease
MSQIPAVKPPMSPREWALLLALSVLWGGSFFFVGIAVQALPPLTIVVCRVGLASLALLAVVRLVGANLPADWRLWRAFFGMALLNNVIPFLLIVWGQTQIASGLAAILNATTPLWTVVVAHGLTDDEKMTGRRVLGVLLGLVGVAAMIGGAAVDQLGVHILGQLAVLAAACSYAFAGVFGRRFKAMGVSPLATAAGQVTASSAMLLPVALVVDRPWTLSMPGMETIGALFGLALLSTAVAYILYFRVLATAGATNLLLVTLLIPVTACLLGVMLLGETLETNHGVGMALIGLGLAAIDGRPGRALRRMAVGWKPAVGIRPGGGDGDRFS